MPIRITGMNSGLDTESIIAELVKAKSTKKDSLVKAQTKLQWKQDAWKELNSKVYSLYSKTLSNMRLKSDYGKKTTKVSDSSIASVITGSKAVNGVQTLKVDELATTGYLTGGELKVEDSNGVKKKASYKSTDKLKDLGVEVGSELELKVNGKTTKIIVDDKMTIDSFVKRLQDEGVNASFDEKNQRFFISSKESGEEADFSLTANNQKGIEALQHMGIATSLNEDEAARQAYMTYCKEVKAEGKVVGYELRDDVVARANEEMAERIAKFGENKAELKNVQDEIAEIKANYTDTDGKYERPNQEELKKEIEKKTEDYNKGIGNVTQEELEALNKKYEDAKKLDSLEEQEKNLTASIAAEEPYIEEVVNADNGSVTYQAKMGENNVNLLEEAILEKANFALGVLKGSLDGADTSSGATRIAGKDAKIFLNGAEFTSNTNTFEINGLTITAQSKSDKEITITTADDTDGIYDMVKNFLKEYNELINEMDKLYNADSAKGYEPLTEEEKEAMSEKEVEKWEEKIKNSVLRRDSTLSTVSDAMKQIMLQGVSVNGKQMYLSDFGINTLGYFSAKNNEKNAYHIDGDPDDTATMANADKLKTAIANDPESVVEFFSTLSMNLYNKLGGLMKKTEYSSSFTLYDDVAMKNEYNDYTSKISKQEQKITDYEDRYYKKFTAMETALAKLSSKESAVSGMLGM